MNKKCVKNIIEHVLFSIILDRTNKWSLFLWQCQHCAIQSGIQNGQFYYADKQYGALENNIGSRYTTENVFMFTIIFEILFPPSSAPSPLHIVSHTIHIGTYSCFLLILFLIFLFIRQKNALEFSLC